MNISNPSEMVDSIIFIKLGESKMKVDFNKMNNGEKIEFISERGGYIKDEIGVDSCGNEFRDDNGSALFVKEISDEEI